MKLSEVDVIMRSPEYSNRVAVLVYDDPAGGLKAEWEGRTFIGSNVFQLDSRLDGYVPAPRNLFYINEE